MSISARFKQYWEVRRCWEDFARFDTEKQKLQDEIEAVTDSAALQTNRVAVDEPYPRFTTWFDTCLELKSTCSISMSSEVAFVCCKWVQFFSGALRFIHHRKIQSTDYIQQRLVQSTVRARITFRKEQFSAYTVDNIPHLLKNWARFERGSLQWILHTTGRSQCFATESSQHYHRDCGQMRTMLYNSVNLNYFPRCPAYHLSRQSRLPERAFSKLAG